MADVASEDVDDDSDAVTEPAWVWLSDTDWVWIWEVEAGSLEACVATVLMGNGENVGVWEGASVNNTCVVDGVVLGWERSSEPKLEAAGWSWNTSGDDTAAVDKEACSPCAWFNGWSGWTSAEGSAGKNIAPPGPKRKDDSESSWFIEPTRGLMLTRREWNMASRWRPCLVLPKSPWETTGPGVFADITM